MKLGKTSWMILLAGIFVVVIGSLGLARYQQLGAQQQLSEEFSIANARVINLQFDHLREQEADLKVQLKESQDRVGVAKDRLRNDKVQSIQITDDFFDIADACGVEVVSLSTTALSGEELGTVVCQSVPFSGRVEGSLADIVRFVHKLNSDYTTGVVKNASISIINDDDSLSTNTNDPASGEVRLIAYTYEGK